MAYMSRGLTPITLVLLLGLGLLGASYCVKAIHLGVCSRPKGWALDKVLEIGQSLALNLVLQFFS
jgi:hypothetical protein